jgi:hypothetical protein
MRLAVSKATWRWGAMLMVCLMMGIEVSAADVSEDSVKAGFILNFTKYTDWPANGTGNDPLLICSLCARALSGSLEVLQGRVAKNREIRVRASTRPSELHECKVLFIAADEESRVEWVLQRVAKLPMLTVSDVPNFVHAGGMIGLFHDNDRLRFDINLAAARQSNLVISSNLLRLARTVKQ